MTEPMPEYRAPCPICQVTCEQRRCFVLLPGADNVWTHHVAYKCIECEGIHVAAEQPAPLLPPGWSVDTRATHMPEAYVHTSGARVQRFVTDGPNCWTWYTPSQTYGAKCREPMPTMADAMTAALEVRLTPAECHAALERAYGCSNCRVSSPRECAESGHLHCDTGQESAPAPGGNPNTALLNTATDPSGSGADNAEGSHP